MIKWRTGDIFFDVNGKSKIISGPEKTAQDIGYFLLQELSSNNIKKKNPRDLQGLISGAITKLKSIQVENNAPDNEKIKSIAELVVVQNPDTKTDTYFYISVKTEANDLVSFLFDTETYTDLSHLIPENF